MVHITALALVPAAPPGFPGAMAWSPSHACAPDIMGNSRLRPPGHGRLDWLIARRRPIWRSAWPPYCHYCSYFSYSYK